MSLSPIPPSGDSFDPRLFGSPSSPSLDHYVSKSTAPNSEVAFTPTTPTTSTSSSGSSGAVHDSITPTAPHETSTVDSLRAIAESGHTTTGAAPNHPDNAPAKKVAPKTPYRLPPEPKLSNPAPQTRAVSPTRITGSGGSGTGNGSPSRADDAIDEATKLTPFLQAITTYGAPAFGAAALGVAAAGGHQTTRQEGQQIGATERERNDAMNRRAGTTAAGAPRASYVPSPYTSPDYVQTLPDGNTPAATPNPRPDEFRSTQPQSAALTNSPISASNSAPSNTPTPAKSGNQTISNSAPQKANLSSSGPATSAAPAPTVTPVSSTAKANSAKLKSNLIAAKQAHNAGDHAHHIVAGTAKKAGPARAVLAKHGIDINDASNGQFLPGNVHSKVHTKKYFDAINRTLLQANTKQRAEQALKHIANKLKTTGKYP